MFPKGKVRARKAVWISKYFLDSQVFVLLHRPRKACEIFCFPKAKSGLSKKVVWISKYSLDSQVFVLPHRPRREMAGRCGVSKSVPVPTPGNGMRSGKHV